MKRYIALIFTSLLCLGVVVFLFYLLLKQDNMSYVTYIRFQVNPSFVIGINKNENVVFFNALNSDASKYNLSMFQGKSLSDATKIFIEKLGESKTNKDTINLTVMTKNKELENHIVDIISNRINNFDNKYKINVLEANRDELEHYSNEIIYNLTRTYSTDKLESLSKDVYMGVKKHIEGKINKLNLKKLNNSQILDICNTKKNEGYFNDLMLNSITLSDNDFYVGKNSSYKINFSLDKDNNFIYQITLYLELNYTKNGDKTIVETYDFQYDFIGEVETISHLKTYFYTF